MNANLISKALDQSALAVALINEKNLITWSTPAFAELVGTQGSAMSPTPGVTEGLEVYLLDALKPLLLDKDQERLASMTDSSTQKTLRCVCQNSEKNDISIQLGGVVARHRTVVILQQHHPLSAPKPAEIDPLTGLGMKWSSKFVPTDRFFYAAVSAAAGLK